MHSTHETFREASLSLAVASLPTWIVAVLFILVLPVAVVGVQIGIRRRWPALAEGRHNEVAGFLIAVVGVIYAVLLAFVVIVSWEKFNDAESITGQEASVLRSMYRDAAQLPPPASTGLRALVVEYADDVAHGEWAIMAEGSASDPHVTGVLDRMSSTLGSVVPPTAPAPAFVQSEIERLDQLVSLRSQRLDFVDQGLPGVLWVALFLGAVVTIGFAMIFGLQRAGLHLLMVGSLASLVGVLLFVITVIDFPFQGSVRVEPHAMERVLSDLSR